MDKTDQRFDRIDKRFDKLDEKIAEINRNLTSMLRKGNDKLVALTNKLSTRKILPATDVTEVLSLEPFPKSV